MEKKTIGSFIAALRRANGLTQRELAEKLNVSDKAVSRWERDESAPDLTLLPVIAEIFGVTTDELLRGERMERDEVPGGKSEKQLAQLLKSTRQKLSGRSWIAVGLCVAGLLFGLIVFTICMYNMEFRAYSTLRAVRLAGFFTACVFYAAAAICEGVFVAQAFSAVDRNELDSEAVHACRRRMFATAGKTFGCVFAFFVAMLFFLYPDDTFSAFAGIFLGGAVGALAAIPIYFVANWVAFCRGVLVLSQKEQEQAPARRKLKQKYGRIFAVVLLVTILGHGVFAFSTTVYTFTQEEVFRDLDVFVEYMEVTAARTAGSYSGFLSLSTDEFFTEGVTYKRQFIHGADGQVIASYIPRNQDVAQIHYGDGEDSLPITVYSGGNLLKGARIRHRIQMAFVAAYFVEITTAVLLYRRQRKRIK